MALKYAETFVGMMKFYRESFFKKRIDDELDETLTMVTMITMMLLSKACQVWETKVLFFYFIRFI